MEWDVPDEKVPPTPIRGRGAVTNATGRFERLVTEAVDDGWGLPTGVDGRDGGIEAPPVRTHVTLETPRKIITTNASPDIPFEQSINPYRGCEHGCVYCYARPSHTYMGLSAGLDFETQLFAKPNAAALLDRELRKPGYTPRLIMLGANTDPYQPIERRHEITRDVLGVLAAFRHPTVIITKSHLVTRDLDILGPMAADGLVSVAVSVTTLDRHLANTLEPRAATPTRRLDAIRQLAAAGVPTTVMAAPMIPFLNDAELDAILQAGADAGAKAAGYILLRLPHELKDLFAEWLEAHAPLKAKHVMNEVRDMRGGKLYTAEWGARMRGAGPFADLLERRYRLAVKRLGLGRHRNLESLVRTDLFTVPPKPGDQMNLF